jgi:hypothetical protein
MPDQFTVRIEFVDNDPTRPDPAGVSACADQILTDLRRRGIEPYPVYTGAMGGDVYEIVRQLAESAAENKEVLLALINGVVAPIVSVLAERLKAKDRPSDAQHTVIVIVEGAQAEVIDPDISAEELLRRLLVSDPQLAERVSPATKPVVQVRVAGYKKR